MNIKMANNQKNTLSRQERPDIMKKLFIFVLALSMSVLASEPSLNERVDGLQAQVDRAMARAGIHFNGEFRSQFFSSTIDADREFGKRHESVEYTSVDFDIVARPNTALSARAIFRLHQDWRNFFSDVQNPITSRWVSIDGSMMHGILQYNLGDYQKKLTPLTLWSPDMDFLYEPEIFAQSRRLAMSEVFMGDNNRLLQGATLGFKAEIYPILHELTFDFFGARLATTGTGESGVTAPGVHTNPPEEGQGDHYYDADYDKYLVGTNLGVQVMEGFGLGISSINIFDHKASYRHLDGPDSTWENNAKLNSQATHVFAGRLNVDNRVFMDDDFVRIGIDFETAYSIDTDNYLSGNGNVMDSTIVGMAINAGLSARFNFGNVHALRLKVGFINNDATFRNDAAQSPTFFQQKVMNNEAGVPGNLNLLNPFDAMYRSVFKHTPSQYFGGTNPRTKNAYNIAILTPEEVGKISGSERYDYPNVFQTALGGGMATADRTGPVINICGSFLDEAITVGAKVATLTTAEEVKWFIPGIPGSDDTPGTDGQSGSYTPEFLDVTFGAGFDIAKFAPIVGPSLLISGSYGMYNAKYDVAGSTESALISVGIDYNFWQRFSFLFGYQQLTTDITMGNADGGTLTFDNMAFGFAYKLAPASDITAKVSMLSGEGNDAYFRSIGAEEVKGRSYKAMQPEVYLTVRF